MSVLEIKDAVRARDGYCCVECGMTNDDHQYLYSGKSLDVHRLSPGSTYTVDGCVTLCRGCHGPKPKSPRGTYPRPDIRASYLPADLYEWLKQYAVSRSTPYDKKSVAWAFRQAVYWFKQHVEGKELPDADDN